MAREAGIMIFTKKFDHMEVGMNSCLCVPQEARTVFFFGGTFFVWVTVQERKEVGGGGGSLQKTGNWNRNTRGTSTCFRNMFPEL